MLTEEGDLIGASIIRAASNGDVDAVSTLLAEGADADQKGRGGHTALMVAAIFNHVDIARLLLAAGADTRLKDNLGLAARDWADRRGSWDVAQLLGNDSLAEEPQKDDGKLSRPNVEAPDEPDPTKLTQRPVEAARLEAESDLPSSSTEPTMARQPDAIRFMKFHRQIMASQERSQAEQARRAAEQALRASPFETDVAPPQSAPAVADEPPRVRAEPTPREKEARPTAMQLVGIAATIEHLRLLEESSQRIQDEVLVTSERVRPATAESGPGHNEDDATLERFPVEMSTLSRIEPTLSAPSEHQPCKRCPECNTTYENPLLIYCAYDATKLVSADDSMFSYSAPRDRVRQTLWALLAIMAVLGATLGYFINNRRSSEIVSSAPIAPISAPIATQPAQPEVTKNHLPSLSSELSGMEVDLPEPEYPAQARAEGVSGSVAVRVQVNQKGRVVLARSSRGDWRLRAAAVEAAQKATFSPEKLNAGGRVISGTITYRFVAPTESPTATSSQVAPPTNSPSANGSSAVTGSPATNVGADYPVVGGPLVGTETALPQPDYPANAKSRGISGTITVVVRVSRAGKVISWRTSAGDSQLRAAALKAAKKATFSPAKLPGKGEVVGSITYNFK